MFFLKKEKTTWLQNKKCTVSNFVKNGDTVKCISPCSLTYTLTEKKPILVSKW